MKTQFLTIIVVLLLIFSCRNYKPFSSIKHKKESMSQIKKTFNLKPEEFKLIKKEDSILYEISESIDKQVKLYTTNRRIDSFINGNYKREQLLLALNIDQLKLEGEFDFDYTDKFKNTPLNFKSIEELDKFMRKMDSSLMNKTEVKIDTLKKKN